MNWFGKESAAYSFQMFQGSHWVVMMLLVMAIIILYRTRKQLQQHNFHVWEKAAGISLLVMEGFYHIWLFRSGFWSLDRALPLELCNISVMLTIALLLTGRKAVYDIVFFIGLAGAAQAVLTPVLSFDFPHFRYLHFFYVHNLVILTALYFTWVKGYHPTWKAIWKTMLFLNILLPFILLINRLTGANYMFLRHKPGTRSLLDWLGPYPWYILTLEIVAAAMFIILWLLFRERIHRKD